LTTVSGSVLSDLCVDVVPEAAVYSVARRGGMFRERKA